MKNKVDNTVDLLHIKEFYEKHKDYIANLIKLSNVYSYKYREDLLETFPELFNSIEDVANSIFFTNLEKEKWDRIVLSKLTYDIIKEFES